MKLKLLIMFIMTSTAICAQDVIVKKDGSTILSKVLEVNTSDIKYKKFSNLNGPTYSISKDEIMSVNYENGEKDIFNVAANNTHDSENNTIMIESAPTSQNASLIACHNQDNHYAKKSSKSKAAYKLNFAHISSNSTLQNSEIEISFAPPSYGTFKIKLVNLTNNMLYIDLGNCFRVYNDGSFGTYYENTVVSTSETQGGSTGAGLNLGSIAGVLGIGGAVGTLAGGVNVGGSTSNSSTTTTVTYQERYITIPPKSSYIFDDKGESFRTYGTGRDLCVGEEIIYTESDSPDKTDYIFTYSSDRNFSKYGTIKATIYLAKQIGSKFVWRPDAKKYITGLDKNTLWDLQYVSK